MRDVVASMRVAEKGLGAIGGRFHWPVYLFRRPEADGFVGVDEIFEPKLPPTSAATTPELVSGARPTKAEQDHPRDVRVLACRRKRHRVRAGIVVAERGARLHRIRNQAVVDQIDFVTCAAEAKAASVAALSLRCQL